MSKSIRHLVWRPRNEYEMDFSIEYCSMMVHDSSSRSVGFHQCNRKPIETIDGYGWCKQHADEIRHFLGIENTESVKYVCEFQNGYATIAEVQVVSESDKTIRAASVKSILGITGYGTSIPKKGKSIFLTLSRAYEWAANYYEQYADRLDVKAEEARKEAEELRDKA